MTVTWKVTDNIYQHVDILEKNKKDAFSLGQSLWIGKEEFEDLDEIISRYINPMAACARDLLNYKYYQHADGGKREKAEEIIRQEKSKYPNKIHYIFSACSVRYFPLWHRTYLYFLHSNISLIGSSGKISSFVLAAKSFEIRICNSDARRLSFSRSSFRDVERPVEVVQRTF